MTPSLPLTIRQRRRLAIPGGFVERVRLTFLALVVMSASPLTSEIGGPTGRWGAALALGPLSILSITGAAVVVYRRHRSTLPTDLLVGVALVGIAVPR